MNKRIEDMTDAELDAELSKASASKKPEEMSDAELDAQLHKYADSISTPNQNPNDELEVILDFVKNVGTIADYPVAPIRAALDANIKSIKSGGKDYPTELITDSLLHGPSAAPTPSEVAANAGISTKPFFRDISPANVAGFGLDAILSSFAGEGAKRLLKGTIGKVVNQEDQVIKALGIDRKTVADGVSSSKESAKNISKITDYAKNNIITANPLNSSTQKYFDKISQRVEEVGSKIADVYRTNKSELEKFLIEKSSKANYSSFDAMMARQKQYHDEVLAYKQAMGGAASDMNQGVIPGFYDDLQRSQMTKQQIELLGKDAPVMSPEDVNLNTQMDLPALPTKPQGAFNPPRGDDLTPLAQSMVIDEAGSNLMLNESKQANILNTDLTPKSYSSFDALGVKQGTGQLQLPIKPVLPVRPNESYEIINEYLNNGFTRKASLPRMATAVDKLKISETDKRKVMKFIEDEVDGDLKEFGKLKADRLAELDTYWSKKANNVMKDKPDTIAEAAYGILRDEADVAKTFELDFAQKYKLAGPKTAELAKLEKEYSTLKRLQKGIKAKLVSEKVAPNIDLTKPPILNNTRLQSFMSKYPDAGIGDVAKGSMIAGPIMRAPITLNERFVEGFPMSRTLQVTPEEAMAFKSDITNNPDMDSIQKAKRLNLLQKHGRVYSGQ